MERLGGLISAEAREQVHRLLWLLEVEPVAGVRNLNPAYCSVLLTLDAARKERLTAIPAHYNWAAICGKVSSLYEVQVIPKNHCL